MSAFKEKELDWRRLDVYALLGVGGLAVVNPAQRAYWHDWLSKNHYRVETLDLGQSLNEAFPALERVLEKEREGQIGFAPTPDSRNLNALRDAFEFVVPESGGVVLEIFGADQAWQEDSYWLTGLLSIARERSLWYLGSGKRFFTLLVLPSDSRLIGAVVEEIRIPIAFWSGAGN